MIPKPGLRKMRRLGIPTVADRVVQAALKLVLEPIWEADFQPCSYGFRPNRRAHDAIAETVFLASKTYEWVLEGDIEVCFDEISHPALMDRVRVRIGDRRVLALVKAFLKAGILAPDGFARDSVSGTPQGGILSPLRERRLEVETAEGTVELTADQVVVAAGSCTVVPPIPGLAEVGFRTSDDVRTMERLPRRMAVVGGGFVATELAHVFSSFGVEVTVVEMLDQLLAREDAEIAQRFTELAKQQWDIRLERKMVSARRSDNGIILSLEGPQGAEEVEVDEVMMAIGRRPNSDLVDAAAGGLATHRDGRIMVDEQQATSVSGVWALGDVSSKWMLKHVVNAEAETVMHNVLHPQDLIATDHRYVPHAAFSSPQIAAVGLTEQEAKETGTAYVVGRTDYSDIAYGWAMEDTTGFAKVLADPATGKLLGARIIGPQAPTLIQAMSLGQDARSVASGQFWIHPSMPEVVQGALNNLPLD